MKLKYGNYEITVESEIDYDNGVDPGIFAFKLEGSEKPVIGYFCEGLSRGDSVAYVFFPDEKTPKNGDMSVYEYVGKDEAGYSPNECSDGMGLPYDGNAGAKILAVYEVTGDTEKLQEELDKHLATIADWDRVDNPYGEEMESEEPEI